MSMLDTLLNRDSELTRALEAYPVFAWPHPGTGIDLSPAQRDENLAWLLSVRHERIAVLTDLLGDLGVALPSPDDPTLDPATVSLRLDDLAKRRFIKVSAFETACAPANATTPGWRDRPVSGLEAAARSVAIDLGIYVGECATHASEPFDWRIGESRYRPANMPTTAGEVTISKLSQLGPQPNRIYLDVIAWSVYAVWDVVRYRKHKTFWKLNHFEFLNHIVGNRY